MKKIVSGPFDGDIWTEVECRRLVDLYTPDTVVIYERGIPLTHVWFSQKIKRVVNATHGECSNCTKPVKKMVGNIEIWNDIPLSEVCSDVNSGVPTLFYMEPSFLTPRFVETLSKCAKDWILIIKNMESLPQNVKDIMDSNCPGYMVYCEPIKPAEDPRRDPMKRLVVIDPQLVEKGRHLCEDVDGVNRSTCVEMHTQESVQEKTSRIIKLTEKV